MSVQVSITAVAVAIGGELGQLARWSCRRSASSSLRRIGRRIRARSRPPAAPPSRCREGGASSVSLSDLVVEIGGRDDAAVEVAQIELLVRRVRVLVRQADAEQHRRAARGSPGRWRRPESSPPSRLNTGVLAEPLLDRAAGGLDERLSKSVIHGLPPCMRVTLTSTVFGAIFFDVVLEELRRSCRDPDPARGAC